MAKLFDAPPDATISFPITKMEETPDGDLLIYGKATDGSVDSDDQIVDAEWSGKALQEWLKTGGNVRVQHSPNLYPAGNGVEVDVDKNGSHWVKSLIVEDTAKKLVKKGVLRAYSVGIAKPRIVRDASARGGRIVDGQIAELSLVDRPANKNCGFTLCKSDASGDPHAINKMFGTVPTNGAAVTTVAPEEMVTATVSFTPKDLAAILGKSKKPESVGGEAANPTNAGGGPKDDDAMSDKTDTGGGKETATASAPYHTDLDEDDKGRVGKAARPTSADMDDDAKDRAESAVETEPDGDEDDGEGDAEKVAGPFAVEKRQFSAEQRQSLADSGKAMSDGSFPIANGGDLHNAIQAIGRAKDPAAAKSHIKRRAAALGMSDQIPDTWKAEEPVVTKADDPGIPNAAPPFGSKKRACPSCKKMNKAKAKFCSKCGAKMSKPDVEKGMGRSPAEGVRAKTTEGLPAHREPDGAQTAELERDAGLKTDGEGPGTGVPGSDWDGAPPARPQSTEGTSLKFDGPWEMKRLHDLTCAAFSAKSLNAAYPNLPTFGHAVDVGYWRQEALKSVSNGDLGDAAGALARAQAADLLKGGETDVITEAQAELHKSFTDMYPDVKEPTPTELDPGRYTRPYLQAGHARETLAPLGSQPPKPRAHEVDAQQFNRGPLTAGHERPSPANKGPNAGAPGGMSAGVYYGNAARAQAANAMIALHDHISGTWPSLCPMGTGAPQAAVGKSETVNKGATTTTNSSDVSVTLEPVDPWYSEPYATITKAVTTTGGGVAPELMKAAIKEAVAEATADLREQLDEMSKLADPRETAYRGPGMITKSTTTDEIEAEPQSVIQKAAKQRNEALFGYLQTRSQYAPTPAEREQARVALQQMYQNNAG